MSPPRHLPSAGSGTKENISRDGGATLFNCSVLRKEGASSANTNKKPAGFNLRKSIAWNPAFFTEQGVLDTSELSLLTGSQLMPNGSPSSMVSGTMSPLCRSGRSGNAYVLKEVTDNSCRKLPAKYHSPGNHARKLFSSAKTPQRDQRKESVGTQNRSSARSIQKSIPRVPSESIQKKVPTSSSTPQMPRIPKKSQPSLPTVPRNTSSMTTINKSNIKLPPVKVKQTHRVPGHSVSSGPSIVKNVVPAVTDIHEEARGSVKCKTFPSHAQSNPSSSSTFAKPSALRMPSPSVGFFTQENAHASYGDAAKRNVGMCFVGNTSSAVKPPRYKQPEDLTSRLRLTKPLSTNCTSVSSLVLPVTRESNRNTLVGPEKECSSKVITTYSAKSGDVNNKKGPDVSCLLAANGAATQPLNSENNDAARNSMPIVSNDSALVERRGIKAEIEHVENTYSLEAICSSTLGPVEDPFPLESTSTSTKPIVGGTLSPSRIYSQICSSSDLTCQSKSDRICSAEVDLKNCYVGETALAVSLVKDDSCTPALDFLQGFDSCDQQDTECSTVMEAASAICADQVQCCGSGRDETAALVDSTSGVNDSLCNAKPVMSEEPDADGGMELETNNMLAVNELLHVGCEHSQSYRSTECPPMRPEEERQHVSSVESNMEDKMVLDTNKPSALKCSPHIEKNKAVDRSRTNTILKDHLKNLVPFSEEWLAVMEARGQEVLEQKSGAVQNSPPDKAAPEPSPWSPVKRKAQDVGPFDCTKYSKSVRKSGTP